MLQAADEEREANDWATNFLISQRTLKQFITQGSFAEANVVRFAKEQEVAPGIVVGQLQNKGAIGFSKPNHLKEKMGVPK